MMNNHAQPRRRPVSATVLAGLLHAGLLLGQERLPKVLVLGVDGTRLDALAVARTPHLDALRATGCFSDRAITHPVTHSASCWSSMFTGVWGDKHGVNDPGNSFVGNQLTNYPSYMALADTNPPPGQAFYRLDCRKP